MTKIDPVKIWWLIIALWIIPAALADVHLAPDSDRSAAGGHEAGDCRAQGDY